QCRCEAVDRRTDVYSLAIMLYELTTGRPAITADNEQDMIARMADARVAPPRTIDPAYPPELEAIVMRALARDREQRYPTAQAMQQELEAFARRAALSYTDLAMSRFMSRLFARELVTWHRARESGLTLEQHVVRETLRPRSRRRSLHRAVPIGIVVALFAVAYLAARWIMAG